jgi:formylglycine-generating enzyme required for sulfatase activity
VTSDSLTRGMLFGPAQMLSPNTILQNRYCVVRKLGEGGMGAVYEAIDQRVSCLVALKETLATRDNEARDAFEREAALLANLRHQALPKVMDYFSENEGDFLVMEFIPGYDLAELLDLHGGPFPQSQVLRWADELLKVLDYLHSQEPPILHRDIKPSNLKLTKQGEIFLLDFGLAKGTVGQMPTLVTSRSVHGYTPVYASLEQILGQGTDPRSDLYSVGATLYQLLTAVPPADAPARFRAAEDEQADPLEPLGKLNPQVSANVAALIQRAMAISRKQRPASAAEMRKALRLATEEDEQDAVEEEYRRAESRRQQRDTERDKAVATAREVEEERQRQEAESRRLEEERRREAEERRREEEAAARKAEAERQLKAEAERQRREAAERLQAEADRRRREEERIRAEEAEQQRRAGLAETTPTAAVQSPGQAATRERKSQPGAETLNAPPPDRVFSVGQGGADGTRGILPIAETSAKHHAGTRIVIIAAAAAGLITVVALVVAVVFWLTRGNLTPNQGSAERSQPPQVSPQPKQTEKKIERVEPLPPEGMVYVPAGSFLMGRDKGKDEAERPAHQVKVGSFYLDIYEVTNEGYEKFVQATGHRAPTTWANGRYPTSAPRKPVTGVTWDDANAYAKWAKKRLPTEAEWEFAARGTDRRVYPWGNDWQQGSANANGASQSMADVGFYKGTSPFGAFDMIGNAWEWTASDLRAYAGGRLPPNLPSGTLKVIRGGSYESTKDYATTTYRTGWPARGASTYAQTGFRCVSDVAVSREGGPQ